MYNELHEECGVFGVYSRDGLDVASLCYYGLYALQHRGQESCGIAINDDGVIHCHKGAGLVSDIFTPEALHSLGTGQMAVAHVRYGTMGTDPRLNAQPLVVNHICLLYTSIADDDPGMLLMMRKLIERAEDYELVGEAQNGGDLLALYEKFTPML